MSVLKGFSRLEVCSYIQNGFTCVSVCLDTAVSRNVMSLFEISAVNLMVGWCEFTCGMNLSISGLQTSHNGKMSPIYRFQIIGFMTLLLKFCVSRSAIKIFAKETAILVPLAVP